MAKKNSKRSHNAAGKLKKVNKPNPKRKEKQRELHSQKFAKYQIKKAEEQQAKDTMARQAALEKMGMPVEQQNFGYEDDRVIFLQLRPRARPPSPAPHPNDRRICRSSGSNFVPRVSPFGVFIAPCL